MNLIDSILADAHAITAMRRDIHAHPELCFQEVRTADVIAQARTIARHSSASASSAATAGTQIV